MLMGSPISHGLFDHSPPGRIYRASKDLVAPSRATISIARTGPAPTLGGHPSANVTVDNWTRMQPRAAVDLTSLRGGVDTARTSRHVPRATLRASAGAAVTNSGRGADSANTSLGSRMGLLRRLRRSQPAPPPSSFVIVAVALLRSSHRFCILFMARPSCATPLQGPFATSGRADRDQIQTRITNRHSASILRSSSPHLTPGVRRRKLSTSPPALVVRWISSSHFGAGP